MVAEISSPSMHNSIGGSYPQSACRIRAEGCNRLDGNPAPVRQFVKIGINSGNESVLESVQAARGSNPQNAVIILDNRAYIIIRQSVDSGIGLEFAVFKPAQSAAGADPDGTVGRRINRFDIIIGKTVGLLVPVSYTHLTLPTIYS